MLSIILLGTGNVARHLFDAFQENDHLQVVQVVGRNTEALNYFKKRANITSEFKELKTADIYIIALSDDVISTVSKELRINNKLVVHTSGAVEMAALTGIVRPGVFYPLQTFSNENKINFKEVPICIEAKHREDLEILRGLAARLSDKVYVVSSERRRVLHLAAVFVNNFTNYMYVMAADICRENDLPFELLKPLIEETANKVKKQPPYEVQTGPARRNDSGTMKKHLELLKNTAREEIYSVLSKSIRETYRNGNQ